MQAVGSNSAWVGPEHIHIGAYEGTSGGGFARREGTRGFGQRVQHFCMKGSDLRRSNQQQSPHTGAKMEMQFLQIPTPIFISCTLHFSHFLGTGGIAFNSRKARRPHKTKQISEIIPV